MLETGKVACWGRNKEGQLGGEKKGGSSRDPVIVENITDAVDVFANQATSCAIVDEGAVYCWGSNHEGFLGSDDLADSNVPVHIPNLDRVTALAGDANEICATRARSIGAIWCWGTSSSTPYVVVRVTEEGPIVGSGEDAPHESLAVGVGYLCWVGSRSRPGYALCRGSNYDGQLGDGTTTDSHRDVALAGGGFVRR